MIQPLDMQVAFNAVPETAGRLSAEQAGLSYRQVQDLGRARQENLTRQERINETRNRADPTLAAYNPRNEETSGPASRSRMERRRGWGDDKERRPYVPSGGKALFKKAYAEENSGLNLDLIA